MLDKLVELELGEYHGQLREIGVKRVHDLALVTDQELRDIGMNKYDRAALLSVRAEAQESRFVGVAPFGTSSAAGVSFGAAAGVSRIRWVEEATQLFMQFSVTDEDGRPSLTREGWEAMAKSCATSAFRSPQHP